MRGQTTEATMQHDYLTAEFDLERNRPLTHHGQPVAGLHLHRASEYDAAYGLALAVVEWIDTNLESGRVHYRNRAGVLLLRLNEIVEALGTGELAEATQ